MLKERAIERLSTSRFQTKRRAEESEENETGTTWHDSIRHQGSDSTIPTNRRQHSSTLKALISSTSSQISQIGLGNDQSQNHRDSRPEISSQY